MNIDEHIDETFISLYCKEKKGRRKKEMSLFCVILT